MRFTMLRAVSLGIVALLIAIFPGGVWTMLVIVNLRTNPGIPWCVAAIWCDMCQMRTNHANVVLASLFAATAVAADRTPAPKPDRTPFGRIEDEDIDHLQEFALKRAGFDVKAEMARVYSSGNKLDEEALGRVFSFSRQFSNLDKYARTYGQMIYLSFLNIGEVLGVPAYVKVIDRQPPDVQQRIRDFLFYPYTRHVPRERCEEALQEARQMYPDLFPKGFRFGHGDPIFANGS
jgi:hypothetical protein